MKNTLLLFLALLAAPFAVAQSSYYPGQQTFQEPNYPITPIVFTAASTAGTALPVPPSGSLVLVGVGTSLTTATFSVTGSMDGTNYISLNIASMTAAGALGTAALTQTQTAAIADYVVNVAGFKYIKINTTSATFTGTSLTIQGAFATHKTLQ